jgi:ABC-type uncharacterized transport system auxiliary subunit
MRAPLTALLGLLLAACVTVDVGNGGSAQTQFVLSDAEAAPHSSQRASPAPVARALLLQAVASDPLAETISIAYSKSAGERSLYQLSTWTERPSRRILQLLQRRLEAHGTFGTVALLGQPVASDLLLAIAVDDIHHDLTKTPSEAILVLQATLFDRRARRQIARQEFSAAVPAEANVAGLATAMNRAVADVFDQVVPWVEQQARRQMTEQGR